MTFSENYQAQVVIVGAGPAGSATAAVLAEQGVDVLLLDRASFPREKTCGDGLTPRSVAVLRDLNLVTELEAAGALRIAATRIYAPNGRSIQVGFDELDGEFPSFGLTIPRLKLDEILLERAQAAGARLVTGLNVRDLVRENGVVCGVEGSYDGRPVVVRAPTHLPGYRRRDAAGHQGRPASVSAAGHSGGTGIFREAGRRWTRSFNSTLIAA